jgi:hypothetical protein
MKLDETLLNCQIPCFKHIAEGIAEVPSESLGRRVKLMIRRRMSPGRERAFKNYTNDQMNRFFQLTGRSTKPNISLPTNNLNGLQTGDWVRVRPLKEIKGTLNHWNQVKGCAFMPEMAEYCGTTHRVLKHMKRFVDERDLVIKKSSGIILLEEVMCRGTAEFGSCDRACFHFWREEWLEKVDEPVEEFMCRGTAEFGSCDRACFHFWREEWFEKVDEPADPPPGISSERLQAGDWVRVRSLKEIEATFNHGKQVSGCAFMPEMAEYCGTKQLVLKPLKRFIDERDLRVNKVSGIILLEGLMCQGAAEFGSCDRSCFYLWREEWLEKIDEQPA